VASLPAAVTGSGATGFGFACLPSRPPFRLPTLHAPLSPLPACCAFCANPTHCLPCLLCSEEQLKDLAEQMQGLTIPEAKPYYRQDKETSQRAAAHHSRAALLQQHSAAGQCCAAVPRSHPCFTCIRHCRAHPEWPCSVLAPHRSLPPCPALPTRPALLQVQRRPAAAALRVV